MRRLKHKHTRRAVRFFRIRHGFREPYKVVFDGNFIAAVRDMKMGEASEVVQKLLGAPVKTYVTRCVLLELKARGKDFAAVHSAAKRAGLHLNCHHDEQPLPGWECLKACVGARNEEHYFVATQERLLRAQLGRVPGGASLFVSPNGAHLEAPSELQRQSAQQEDVADQVLQSEELGAPALEALPELQSQARRRERGSSMFRRKGAKGPNPLSVKKKRPKAAAKQQQRGGREGERGEGAGAAGGVVQGMGDGLDAAAGEAAGAKRRRPRARRRKAGGVGVAEGAEVEEGS